jgi:putative peptidoglycan lipid II flippase
VSEEKKAARSLAGIAGIVAVATLISKVFGLVRQVAVSFRYAVRLIAAAFRVGHAFDVPLLRSAHLPLANLSSYSNILS